MQVFSRHHQAQIMLITIVVITILSVIVVGVVGTALQNVRQTITSQQNEQILNAGESVLLGLVERYSPSVSPLAAISAQPECLLTGPRSYECNITDDQGILNVVQIADTSTVSDFELAKDQGFDLDLFDEINLVSYTGRIDFQWEGSGAIELGLVYESGGNTAVITDVIDLSGIFESGLGDSLNPASSNHPFNLALDAGAGTYYFNLSNIDGLPVGSRLQFVRFTSRRTEPGAISLSVSGDSALPLQVREFITSSYSPDTDVQVITRVKAQVPFLASMPGALYSVLGVQGVVSK